MSTENRFDSIFALFSEDATPRERIRAILQDRLNRGDVDQGTIGGLGGDQNLCRVIAHDLADEFPDLAPPITAADASPQSTLGTLVNLVHARQAPDLAGENHAPPELMFLARSAPAESEGTESVATLALRVASVRDTIRGILQNRLNRQNVDSGSIGTLGGDANICRLVARDLARAFPNLVPRITVGDVGTSSTLNSLVNLVRGRMP